MSYVYEVYYTKVKTLGPTDGNIIEQKLTMAAPICTYTRPRKQGRGCSGRRRIRCATLGYVLIRHDGGVVVLAADAAARCNATRTVEVRHLFFSGNSFLA